MFALIIIVLGSIMAGANEQLSGSVMAVVIGFGVLLSDIAFNMASSRRK